MPVKEKIKVIKTRKGVKDKFISTPLESEEIKLSPEEDGIIKVKTPRREYALSVGDITANEAIEKVRSEHPTFKEFEYKKITYKKTGKKGEFIKRIDPPEKIEQRWQKKKDHIRELSDNVSRLKNRITRDLKSDNEKDCLSALAIAIMLKTGERVGNDESAEYKKKSKNDKRKKAYGVTGFKVDHATIIGHKVHLDYIGKKGVPQEKSFSDEKIAKALKKAIKNCKGEFIFETSDHNITSNQVNDYLREFNISAKAIRGYSANKWVTDKLKSITPEDSDKKRKKQLSIILKNVASKVGHGPSVLKNQYLMPEVITDWIDKGEVFDIKEAGYVMKAGGKIPDNKNTFPVSVSLTPIKSDYSISELTELFKSFNITYKIKKYLGKGSFGKAYETENGRVIKITNNGDEAFASAVIKIMGNDLKRQAKVYNVHKITDGKNNLYVIEKEKVEVLSDVLRDIIGDDVEGIDKYFMDDFRLKFLDAHDEKSVNNALERIYNHIIKYLEHGGYKLDDDGKKKIKDVVRKQFEFMRQLQDDQKISGLNLEDSHNMNIGFSGNKLVCFDCVSGKTGKTYEDGGITPKDDDFANSEKNRIFIPTKITKDELQSIISGKSKVSDGDLIQRTLAYIRREEGANSINRGAEPKVEEERLIAFIDKNNLWYSKELTPPDGLGRGGEHILYDDPTDKDFILKTNNLKNYSSWSDYLINLLLNNTFFPDTSYELIGFKKNEQGEVLPVVRQYFVPEAIVADLKDVQRYLFNRGFQKGHPLVNAYRNWDLGVMLGDLHNRNVLVKDDTLFFIDTKFFLSHNADYVYDKGGNIEDSSNSKINEDYITSPGDCIQRAVALSQYNDLSIREGNLINNLFSNTKKLKKTTEGKYYVENELRYKRIFNDLEKNGYGYILGNSFIAKDKLFEFIDAVNMFYKGKEIGGEIENIKGKLDFKKMSDNLFVVTSDTQEKLAKLFVRPNSYLDCREFKGKIFTLDEFKNWYTKEKGAFTYYQDYKGFNIPDSVINVFLNGSFDPLSAEEKWLIDNLKSSVPQKPYYIIGYVDVNGEEETRHHELAHALYYLSPAYKAEVNEIIDRFWKEISPKSLIRIREFLTKLQYDRSIWNDEMDAYLVADKDYLIEKNAWSEEFEKYRRTLIQVFEGNYLKVFGKKFENSLDVKYAIGGSIPQPAQKQIDEYIKEGIFIKPTDKPVIGVLPISRFNGPNADIFPSQLSVYRSGVEKWKKRIKAGERPYVLIDYSEWATQNRVMDAHHRLVAYEDLGIGVIPVIDVNGKILGSHKMEKGGRISIWKISNIVNSDQGFDILDNDKELAGGTWAQGGCYVLARAIQKVYGGQLKAIEDSNGIMQHVLVQIGEKYIDSDGVSNLEKKLKTQREEELVSSPRLVDFDIKKLGVIPVGSEKTVNKLVNLFNTKMSEGGSIEEKIVQDGVKFSISKNIANKNALEYSIDRVEIPMEMRGKNMLSKAIGKLTQMADNIGATLTTNILPDSGSDEDYNKLRHSFGKHGFIPVEIDGETYRNDLIRKPLATLDDSGSIGENIAKHPKERKNTKELISIIKQRELLTQNNEKYQNKILFKKEVGWNNHTPNDRAIIETHRRVSYNRFEDAEGKGFENTIGNKYTIGGSISKIQQREAETKAQEFLSKLSEKDLKSLKDKFNEAVSEILVGHEKKLNDLLSQKADLKSEIDSLYEQEKGLEFGDAKRALSDKRRELNTKVSSLELEIRHQQNIVKVIFNGGELATFTDKKGTEHKEIPYFVRIKTDMISFDEDTILTDEVPPYIPFIDEKIFADKGYVFDAIRIAPDQYILAVNGYNEKKGGDIIGYGFKNPVEAYHPSASEQGYVIASLDQLALINDYYFTKAKSVLRKKAQERDLETEKRYDALSEERRASFLNQKGYYHSLPASVRKKITKEEYEALDLVGKEKLYKPFGRAPVKRLVSKLEDNSMWISFHEMYERFLNPLALPIKKDGTPLKPGETRHAYGIFGNKEAFAYWYEFRDMMNWKMKDIQVQRETDSEVRKIALETSFGESNTNDSLKQEYGILVKRQNGTKILPPEINQIKEAWIKIQNTFGTLSHNAKKDNLKISHTGIKLVFASKAAGVFIPDMKTIAVSNKFGNDQFEQIMAHEVGHWIDYGIGHLKGKRYACDDFESTAGIIARTFRKNMNQASDSNYINATKECFARAMEQYFALENFGEEATLIYSSSKVDEIRTYHSDKDYVSKVKFNSLIKPLIKQFLSEQESFFKYSVEVESPGTMAGGGIISTIKQREPDMMSPIKRREIMASKG